MTTVEIYKKGEKSIRIVRMVKEQTKRVFFYPETEDGRRLTKTLFARKYDAINLAKYYLSK
jgi:hypothetical protein